MSERREILIDCSPGETRAALVESGRVSELLVERAHRRASVGDVYLGVVSRVLPGMQAAFVHIGDERDAFLHAADVRDEVDDFDDFLDENEARPEMSIEGLLREGQDLVVQIVKEPLGNKGARVTTALSLPGRFLVYTPFSARIGISRRIADEEERARLRDLLAGFGDGGGYIARTAAAGREEREFDADRKYLRGLWSSIERRSETVRAPGLLHREQDLVVRAVRDLVSPDVTAIRVNDGDAYARIVEFVQSVEPSLVPRVEWSRTGALFFEKAGIEAEIEKALRSRVWLKSGGYLVIHPTEALVAVDVNSGRYVGRENLEETILAVNLEAAREVIRQIRLRDLGGIIVVDFIDMEDESHRRQLFEVLEEETKKDRSRSRILEMTEFGLVQITRKRSRASLERALTSGCPTCGGSGRIKNDRTVSMEIRRELARMARSVSAGDSIQVTARREVVELLRGQEAWIIQEAEREIEASIAIAEDDSLPPESFRIAVV
jgi:ribonuclease G